MDEMQNNIMSLLIIINNLNDRIEILEKEIAILKSTPNNNNVDMKFIHQSLSNLSKSKR